MIHETYLSQNGSRARFLRFCRLSCQLTSVFTFIFSCCHLAFFASRRVSLLVRLQAISRRNRACRIAMLCTAFDIVLHRCSGVCMACGLLCLLQILCLVVHIGQNRCSKANRCDLPIKFRILLDLLTHLSDLHIG